MEMTAIDMEVRTLRHEPLRTPSGSCHSDHMEMTAIDMEVRRSESLDNPFMSERRTSHVDGCHLTCDHMEMTAIDMEVRTLRHERVHV